MAMIDHRKPEAAPIVLVTGATGYIGGRLVPRLLEAGYRVRCLARDSRKLSARAWSSHSAVEIQEGDLLDPKAATRALEGVDAAYYLVHSMLAAGSDYAARDRELATNFATAAAAAGCSRLIYLGGLGETGQHLSEHLTSRREVEEALASTDVPVTVFRAAMIIGSGSASFEILRYIVDRLPVMITPRWVSTECQPISVADVLSYLIGALENPESAGLTLDIGSPDVLSYLDIMQIMAEELDLPRRWVIPVPVLTPKLSSLWIHIVTPISHHIARPLAEGLRNRVVCRDDRARTLIPFEPAGVREAIRAAIGKWNAGEIETSWSDAGAIPGDPDWAGGTVYVHREETAVAADPSGAFRSICRIGGKNGWFASDVLWRLRGLIDRLFGGPGLRRGRRHPEELAFGDALDFWRVTQIEPGKMVRLRAEMKLPGEALLEFHVEPSAEDADRCTIVQTARFLPRGLLGILYWWAVTPLHGFVFRDMLQGIRAEAEAHSKQVVSGYPAESAG